MQLIYEGKTDRSLPKLDLPKAFSLSANRKHYSNEKEIQNITNEVTLPHVKSTREELKISSNFLGLLVLGVFQRQMTKAAYNLLKNHNIFISLVPKNMTHIFQPLDLTVNSSAKKFMK